MRMRKLVLKTRVQVLNMLCEGMHMRRFTPLTNGHSKKVANHAHMVALYTLFYNFIRTHSKLHMSPAMAAGIADTFMSVEDVCARIDAKQVPKKTRPRQKTRC